MNKFLAVVKREYIQRVRSKLFVVMTVLGPILLMVFTVVPTLLMGIKTGDTRLAVVDQTDGAKLYGSIGDALTRSDRGSDRSAKAEIADTVNANRTERMEKAGRGLGAHFQVLPVDSHGRSLDEIKRELSSKVATGELEGYLIIPADILKNSETKPVYYGRNLSDVITQSEIEKAVNDAVRKQRLTAAGVSEEALERLSKPVDLEVYPVNEK